MATFCYMAYTWDANKNKTSETVTGVMSGYGFTSGGTTYDFEDRLTGYARASGTFNQSWNLTSVGDWTSVTTNGIAQNRNHGPTHELLTAGGSSVVTDVKGNMTTLSVVLSGLQPLASGLSLSWDFDNKLASADIDANGTADVSFQYDALGRRVARTGTGGSFVFVQMDQQTIADYPVGGAASTPTYRYVYASYIDEPVVRKTAGTGGTLVYFHRNHQYSITAVTTSTGSIAERYAYTAYGQPTILDASASVLSSSAINNRYTYTGREWDATLGLHHFRARWMSPSAGRFLSRDPIGYIDGLNLFANYLSLAFTDADGTCCFGCKAKETDLGSKTTSPSSTGGGDVSLTQKDFSHGKCGAFTWVSQFSIKSPVNPSYIMQHLVIEYEISDCEGKNTTKDKKEIWEAWPYDGRGLFANGIDTYSSSGGGTCTKGKFSMSGSFYLVNGPIPMPPFKSPHPGVVPITQGPATPTNPNVKTKGAGGDHSITVSWDCCECNSWTD